MQGLQKLFWLCAICLLALTGLAAPSGVGRFMTQSAKPACGCGEAFDSLARKVEGNYIGCRLLAGPERGAYIRLKRRARIDAENAGGSRCYEVLAKYVNFFHDGHLFLYENIESSDAEVADRTANAKLLNWSEASVREYLHKNVGGLDPIEGIWYSDSYRLGIVRTGSQGPKFVAIMLSSDVKNWKPGDIKAEIHKLTQGKYKGTFLNGQRAELHMEAAVFKRILLHLGPDVLGKELPLRKSDEGMLDPRDPQRPVFRELGYDSFMITVPSHSPEYRAKLEGLIGDHLEELRTSHLIVLDIRGNEGGSSQTTEPLAPFYHSEAQRRKLGPGGVPVVVSSPDQIKYFEWTLKQLSNPESSYGKMISALVENLKAHPGTVVNMTGGPETENVPERPDTVYDKPEHFAILMDHGNASAAEAFVLAARRFRRVTLFGENTSGTIDYQSVQIVRLDCDNHGILLGYPTVGASKFLPKGGFNRFGVAPDVRIGRQVADPIHFIIRYYASRADPKPRNPNTEKSGR